MNQEILGEIENQDYEKITNQIERFLKEQIENREVIISELGEKLSVTFVDRILFQSGKATVTPKGKEILTKVGQILRNVKSKRIRVEGHTDNKLILPEYQHKFPSNWELSAARAVAVALCANEDETPTSWEISVGRVGGFYGNYTPDISK